MGRKETVNSRQQEGKEGSLGGAERGQCRLWRRVEESLGESRRVWVIFVMKIFTNNESCLAEKGQDVYQMSNPVSLLALLIVLLTSREWSQIWGPSVKRMFSNLYRNIWEPKLLDIWIVNVWNMRVNILFIVPDRLNMNIEECER